MSGWLWRFSEEWRRLSVHFLFYDESELPCFIGVEQYAIHKDTHFIGTNMHMHMYYINIFTHKQAAQQKRNAVVSPAASDWQISPQVVPPEVLSLLALLITKYKN